jgi:hypothetical protein
MRAREFITEQAISPTDSKSVIKAKATKTQPVKPYVAKKFPMKKKLGDFGLDPHDPHSQSQGNSEYGSSNKGDIPLEAVAAMPGAFSVEDIPSDFYSMYRIGVAIAGGERNVAPKDNFGKHPFFMPFSEQEHAKIQHDIERIGHKIELRTTPESLEVSTVNNQSPVAKPKRNKYGV